MTMHVAEIADAVRVRVPGKINLHLSVGDLRADGYHELTNVFQAVTLYDDVVARSGIGLHVRASGEGARQVPTDRANLAWRAAELLADRHAIEPDVHLELHKSIPVAGGMAGGSADAAGALLACSVLWHTGTSKADLALMAAELGSDVAFPLTGGTALGVGRGEQLTPVLATGEYHWVFALADYGITAAAAYAELDRMRAAGTAPAPIGTPDELLDALRSGDCGRLADTLANDLQPAALSLRPQLREVLDAGSESGALAGIVSGSGPTCAFLCAHADAARDLAEQLDAAAVCRATVAATAPAHGARVTF
jgi:4-diphosphocytidyl-2-C-methyl-D-erythritol kinase